MTQVGDADPVEHPAHYELSHPGLECIDLTAGMSFCMGNAVKYVWRYRSKNKPVEDLRKSLWYTHYAENRNEPVALTCRQRGIINALQHQSQTEQYEFQFWNALRDRQGCGEYGRRHKPLLDAAINDIRIRFEGKTVEVEFNDTAPKPLQGFTVTAPVQILEHNTGCWWERTITARIRDGSTIPVVLDHVYWNWITGTPMHIHLDGIQRIRVIEDKHHQREENN